MVRASSRVALPERKTESSLLKVTSLSGFGYRSDALPMKTAGSALFSTFMWPGGKLPLVITSALAMIPPLISPLVSGCFMSRDL